jgi:hypothetical protein
MVSFARLSVLGVALAACTQGVYAQIPANGHVDRITLSSGGVAEIHRVINVDGNDTVRFDIPLEQVDDVLKSLVVQDPRGTVGAITLDGLSPVEETFKGLPFSAQSLGSIADLLHQLPGTRVHVVSGGRSVEGEILGTGTIERKSIDRDVSVEHTLSVLTDDKHVEVLALGSDAVLTILDEPMRDRLAAAVATLGRARADQVRTIAVGVNGTGTRAVGLTYVAAAPLWKPAFRLLIQPAGHARLQGWAVLENATGEDWKDVDLTLASGAPVTLTQHLHERYWRTRPEVPVMADVGQQARTDTASAEPSGRMAFAKAAAPVAMMGAPAPSPEPAQAEAPGFSMSAPAQAMVAEESVTGASFHLPHPVTLAHGRTLSLPFVDADIPAERVALFQPEMGALNPVAAVMIKNTSGSSLPPGILTVYDSADGYVGDAQMPALPVGEQRLASFASDRKVEISVEAQPEKLTSLVTVSDGVLHAKTVSRLNTTYAVHGAADAPRTVLIEHPRRAGWTTKSAQLDSTTPTHERLRVHVAAGATVRVEVQDEQPQTEEFALANANAQQLLLWADAPSSGGLGKKLTALAQLRAKVAAAERALNDVNAGLAAKNVDQTRLRSNLGAVPATSDLGKRYMTLMATAEDEIAALTSEHGKLDADLKAQRAAFAEQIRSL